MTVFHPAWSAGEGADRARSLFADAFDGAEPAGVWSAPGRVNLIGEHVDYNGGPCLPAALPHRTFAALRPRSDRLVRLTSGQRAGVRTIDLDEVAPGTVPGWASYVVGVAWALVAEQIADIETARGFDLALDSCVPTGAGLSSSAALECAVVVALDELWGLGLSDDAGRGRLARACVRAENEIAGAPTGGMDQAAALRCTRGHALLFDSLDGSTEQVPAALAEAGLELLVIDTRAPHQLVDGQYAARRTSCEAAVRRLGVATLREIDDLDGALARLEDEVQRRRVRHVVTEIERVLELVELLRAGPPTGARAQRLGELMAASHTSLREDYEVSCPELDLAVETAVAAGGSARMTGGGFGGSAIALLPAGHASEVAQAVAAAFAAAGFAAPEFLLAPAAGAAGRAWPAEPGPSYSS